MKRSLLVPIVMIVGLLSSPPEAFGQSARRIGDGVFLLDSPGGTSRRAHGWVDLGPDVLGIVSGSGQGARTVVDRIRRASGKPIRALFLPNGTAAAGALGVPRLVPAGGDPTGAALAFDGKLILGRSGVEIRGVERAVSAGNGVVYLPDRGVLFAGDLVGDGAVPDSIRTDAWVRVLERLGRLEPRVVVPGSGPEGGAELLERTRTALVALRDNVRQRLQAGHSLDRILAGLPADAGSRGTALARQIYREAVGLVPPPMIEELELRPGPSPTARSPGWTRPGAVLVRDLWNDGRIPLLEHVAPGVEILVAKTAEEAIQLAPRADASLGWLNPEVIQRGTRLRWIQSLSAGVEGVLAVPGFAESAVTLTNAQRIYGPPIAEHVFGLVLAITRAAHIAVPLMREARWDQSAFRSPEMPELRGKTLLVVGLGGIGTEVAKLGHGLGMRVIATRSTKTPPTDIVEYVGAADELARLARDADVVVNCLPYTPATARVFDAEVFRSMKQTAYFVNIGRGRTVDTDALVAALEQKRIAGAGLDVTDPEPLPAGHRLWSLPNVVITPHVASNSDLERERTWLLFRENLRRFANGEPLLSVVDKRAGY